MENASKALLIAGAILIVIVLISIGMMIVQSSQDTISQVGDMTTKQAVLTFNTDFSNYQGSQRGSSVRTLLQSVATNNATNSSGHIIKISIVDNVQSGVNKTDITASTEITQSASSIVNSAKYNVEITDTDNEGYITAMKITRK